MTLKPLFKPKKRDVHATTRLFLYVQAGGRCEFDGCPTYLLEHYPTEMVGNFAEMAHIYGFKEGAARGTAEGRPSDAEINDLNNLILLCPTCHKLVDDNPQQYPVEVLRKFKTDHENRIFDLTGIPKDRDTIPLVVKGLIAGRPMAISDEEMQLAVAPDYIKRKLKIEMDLTGVPDHPDAAYWQSTQRAIDDLVDRLHRMPTREGCGLKASVFALARIPLLIHIGSRLSDKINVDLYQRHRSGGWRWHDGDGEAQYKTELRVNGDDANGVALLVNLSGVNAPDAVHRAVPGVPAYELTLRDQQPTQLFLKCKGDLERFRTEFMTAMARIRRDHPNLKHIHLFPAVPAPIAVAIGRDRLPNADPPFIVYDRDREAAAFVRTLEIK